MSFDQFHFNAQIAAGIKALGFTTPTPIQRDAIPKVLEGRDVLGLAQTGTGKTAAFVLPILQRLSSGPRGRVRALIVAPTRELAEQIQVAISNMGRQTGLHSITIYGGVSPHHQIIALKRVDIVVACPGRLLDLMQQRHADLSRLEVLVLDEADQMFDMGFLPSIRRIIRALPTNRQTLLFSATMPDDISHLAHECLRDPITVSVNHTSALTTVSHALYPVNEHRKTAMLLELLKPTAMETVLVFTRTKHRAKKLDKVLTGAGFAAASLQGNLSQNRRKAALDGFRSGKFNILVATDIASRGIDVSEITHVINFDIPDTPEAYTHRIGRTGRAAKTGDAFTLVTGEDEAMVHSIERRMGKTLERRRLEGFDYDKAPEAGAPHGHGGNQPHGRPQHHGQRHGGGQGPSSSNRRRQPHRRRR
ncbi:MAG TPA: DEAD/DEAH box helicase [Elusimicrobiota bacterium]|jgi:ATP-dependent RNA helicase RhlE|nr:DEAD/DEAH box helicase [Elusimicrobiota bacterium]